MDAKSMPKLIKEMPKLLSEKIMKFIKIMFSDIFKHGKSLYKHQKKNNPSPNLCKINVESMLDKGCQNDGKQFQMEPCGVPKL